MKSIMWVFFLLIVVDKKSADTVDSQPDYLSWDGTPKFLSYFSYIAFPNDTLNASHTHAELWLFVSRDITPR